MNNENQTIKCSRCKKLKSTTDYTMNIKTNLLYKQCQQCKKQCKDYKKENKEKINEYNKDYNNEYIMDIKNRIRKSVNRRISHVITNKLPDYKFYLGIDIKEYIDYLETRFKEGMNWSNYGTVWNIDHIRPLKPKISISQEETIKRLKYTNTQPLFCIENMIKRNKEIIEEAFEEIIEQEQEEQEEDYAVITFIDEDEVIQVIIDTYI